MATTSKNQECRFLIFACRKMKKEPFSHAPTTLSPAHAMQCSHIFLLPGIAKRVEVLTNHLMPKTTKDKDRCEENKDSCEPNKEG